MTEADGVWIGGIFGEKEATSSFDGSTGCHAHGFAWACEGLRACEPGAMPTALRGHESNTALGGVSNGCHAHGFAWACEQHGPRRRFEWVPCPRLCVGM